MGEIREMFEGSLELLFEPDRALRRALYGGFTASLGATLGWFIWVAGYGLLSKPREILKSAAIGAAVGMIVDVLKEYVHATKKIESASQYSSKDPRKGAVRKATRRPLTAALWMFGTAALFISPVIVDLFSNLVEAMVKPFVASVLVLFPVGAILGFVIHAERPEDSMSVLDGLLGPLTGTFIGWISGLATNIMFMLMGVPWSKSPFGWWILIGLGLGCVCSMFRTLYVPVPVIGVVLALMASFTAVWPLESYAHYAVHSQRAYMELIADCANALVMSPDLPARFWIEAEAQAGELSLHKNAVPKSRFGTYVAHRLSCDATPEATDPPPPKAYFERRAKLCESLRAGWRSELWRSWVVMFMFGVGLGLAKLLDDRLRPDHYGGSTTWKYDRRAATVLVVGLPTIALLLRFM